jgi:hypothetical protein
MININTFILYIFLLKLISFLIYFYLNRDVNISIFLISLFIIFVIYCIFFYIYRFTKYGILRRIDKFTQPLEKIIPVIQKKRTYLSSMPELHDFTLRDFYIFSSHNTYVAGNQNMDVNSLKMIKIACQLGIREIELDVYAKNYLKPTKEFLEPIVTHGVESSDGQNDIFLNSNILSFESCIKTINDNAFLNGNDDPMIINIELNTHNIDYTNNRILEILSKYFGDKLLYSNNLNILQHIKIKDLIGKIIIVIHGINIDSTLTKISFDYFKNVSYDHISELNIKDTKKHIVRVFPPANLESHFSYNCDPNIAWNKGIQFATCNIQVIDEHLKKQFKKFKKYSFVLKPIFLRKKNKIKIDNPMD